MSTEPVTIRYDYYCTACGAKRNGEDRCPACGALKDELRFKGIERVGAAGIGWSDKIGDPSFTANRKKIRLIALPVSLGLALLIFFILLITGVNAATAGVFGAMLFLMFFIPLMLYARKRKSWEGTVLDKRYVSTAGHRGDSYHLVEFKTDDGLKKKQKFRTTSDVYNCLEPGDRVRYIGEIGMDFAYEKYDKSSDSNITCAACGNYQDPRSTYCSVCGCILLKGK